MRSQLVCFTAPMVGNYGVADERGESSEPHGEGGAHASAGRQTTGRHGSASTGSSGSTGSTRAPSSSSCVTAGAMRAAAVSDETDLPVDEALHEVRAQPLDGGPGARRPGLGPGAVRVRRDGIATRGRRRLRRQALDHAASREGGRRRDCVPAHDPRRRARGLRRGRPLERSRRPRAARRGDGDRAGAPRPGADPGDLPRPPAARPRERSSHVQAPVRPSRLESPGARAAHAARARDEPEPRLRGRALRRARRRPMFPSTTARSRGSTSRTCGRAPCSSIPRRGLGRTMPGRSSRASSRRSAARCRAERTSSRSA